MSWAWPYRGRPTFLAGGSTPWGKVSRPSQRRLGTRVTANAPVSGQDWGRNDPGGGALVSDRGRRWTDQPGAGGRGDRGRGRLPGRGGRVLAARPRVPGADLDPDQP